MLIEYFMSFFQPGHFILSDKKLKTKQEKNPHEYLAMFPSTKGKIFKQWNNDILPKNVTITLNKSCLKIVQS